MSSPLGWERTTTEPEWDGVRPARSRWSEAALVRDMEELMVLERLRWEG